MSIHIMTGWLWRLLLRYVKSRHVLMDGWMGWVGGRIVSCSGGRASKRNLEMILDLRATRSAD